MRRTLTAAVDVERGSAHGRIGPRAGKIRRWTWWLTDAGEDLLDGRRIGDEGDDAHIR